MTDKEIEKALEQADDVAISEEVDCYDVLGYINRLKTENEHLQKAKVVYATVDYCADDLAKALAENEQLKKDNADLSVIVKAHKLCVTPTHCQNQDEIRKETAKEIFDDLVEWVIKKDLTIDDIASFAKSFGIGVGE